MVLHHAQRSTVSPHSQHSLQNEHLPVNSFLRWVFGPALFIIVACVHSGYRCLLLLLPHWYCLHLQAWLFFIVRSVIRFDRSLRTMNGCLWCDRFRNWFLLRLEALLGGSFAHNTNCKRSAFTSVFSCFLYVSTLGPSTESARPTATVSTVSSTSDSWLCSSSRYSSWSCFNSSSTSTSTSTLSILDETLLSNYWCSRFTLRLLCEFWNI